MILNTPLLNKTISPFPQNESKQFEFYYTGTQITKNNLVVERVQDSTQVYDFIQETFNFYHNLNGLYLQEGLEYRAKLRVGDNNNNWSNYSDWVHFWCLGNPTVSITTIDYSNQNRVYNQTVNFETQYVHPQNELLQSYRYVLYDSNQVVIESYPEVFANGSSLLTQTIDGLENERLYYLEVKTISIHNQKGSSGLINFKPLYIIPKMSLFFELENLSDMGAIKIKANVVQIIGKINSGTINYPDSGWVDVSNGQIVFDEDFDISKSNFVLKLWCKDIVDNEVFLTLYSENGKIDLIKYNDQIHAFKTIINSNIASHFVSNQLQTQEFMLYLKSVNNLIDLEIVV